MPKSKKLCLDVEHKYIKGIATCSLVTDHKIFLELFIIVVVLHEIKVYLSYAQLVSPID